MKQILCFVLSLLLVFTVSACQTETVREPTVSPEPDPLPTAPQVPAASVEEPEIPTEPDVEETEPAIINPLTGEEVSEDCSAQRPYAIVLNNLEAALPQCGVSQADIIYESLAEGGITRMVAIFQDISQAGILGSIRSARPYLIEYALAYDAIFVHAGGSPQAYSDIATKGVTAIDGVNGVLGTQAYYRDPDRMQNAGYEHSLFSSSDLFAQYIEPLDIRHEHEDGYHYTQQFSDEATPDGQSASQFQACFTPSKATTFQYDPQEGGYLVYEYGEPYLDGNTQEQVCVTNVLCLFTDVAQIANDSSGRLTTRTTGTGTGYFACGGKVTEIQWGREDSNDQFTYTLPDGSSLVLGRGTSYICVLPMSGSVEFAET